MGAPRRCEARARSFGELILSNSRTSRDESATARHPRLSPLQGPARLP
jgi:hypothetical protein